MREPDADTLLFFDAHPRALPLCLAFEERLYAAFPETGKRVRKTQISYSGRRVFACLSFARVRRGLREPWLTVTLGLPSALDSPRAAAQTEPYPGRWTVHIPVCDASELDDELFAWVRAARDFADAK